MHPIRKAIFKQWTNESRRFYRYPWKYPDELEAAKRAARKIGGLLSSDDPTPEEWTEALQHLRQWNEQAAEFRRKH